MVVVWPSHDLDLGNLAQPDNRDLRKGSMRQGPSSHGQNPLNKRSRPTVNSLKS